MPSGSAPYPKKKNVDAGKADKARAVAGGYKRSDTSNEGSNRKIVYPNGNMVYAPGPGKNTNARGEYVPPKEKWQRKTSY